MKCPSLNVTGDMRDLCENNFKTFMEKTKYICANGNKLSTTEFLYKFSTITHTKNTNGLLSPGLARDV